MFLNNNIDLDRSEKWRKNNLDVGGVGGGGAC